MHNDSVYTGRGRGKYVCSTGDDCHLFPLFFLIGKWTRHYSCTVHMKIQRKSTLRPTVEHSYGALKQ